MRQVEVRRGVQGVIIFINVRPSLCGVSALLLLLETWSDWLPVFMFKRRYLVQQDWRCSRVRSKRTSIRSAAVIVTNSAALPLLYTII